MFTVYDKENQPVKVYDVQRDKCGYPQFLIRHGNQWLYRSAKYYADDKQPIADEEVDEILKELSIHECIHNWAYDGLNSRACLNCSKVQTNTNGYWR